MESTEQQQRLRNVQAQIEFFGSPRLRDSYTTLLRELSDERRRLRAEIEQEFSARNDAQDK